MKAADLPALGSFWREAKKEALPRDACLPAGNPLASPSHRDPRQKAKGTSKGCPQAVEAVRYKNRIENNRAKIIGFQWRIYGRDLNGQGPDFAVKSKKFFISAQFFCWSETTYEKHRRPS